MDCLLWSYLAAAAALQTCSSVPPQSFYSALEHQCSALPMLLHKVARALPGWEAAPLEQALEGQRLCIIREALVSRALRPWACGVAAGPVAPCRLQRPSRPALLLAGRGGVWEDRHVLLHAHGA